MPKRECPFEEDLSPQLKVHVGQRQVSNGINKEQEMKKVYAKTLNMLKKGGKEFEEKMCENKADAKKTVSPLKDCEDFKRHKSAFKQMIFNEKMKLQATDKDIVDIADREPCKACSTTAVLAYSRCFYCNKFKCTDCTKECAKCLEYFCDKCSLVIYEDGGEHTECLACYR